MTIKALPSFFIVYILFLSVTLTGQTLDKKEAREKVAGSKFVKLDEKSKSIQFIQMKEETLYSSKGQLAWLKKSLKFTDRHQAKLLKEEMDRKGFTHTKYQICYKDIPVEGSVYIVHSSNGRIQSANGRYVQGQNISVTPSLSEKDAFDKAIKHIHAKKYLWESGHEQRPQGELSILTVDTSYVLTYKFDIYATEPLTRQYVFVNAHSGEIVKTLDRIHFVNSDGIAKTMYNGTVSFKTDAYKGSYRLRETGRGRGIETYNMHHKTDYNQATDFMDTDNNWTDTTDYNQAACDAHFAAEATYDYYYLTFGRNSFDNEGSKILSYVHFYENYNNAFWDGARMTYGDGDGKNFLPLTPIEVVAHEITHGVTQHSAGLIYLDESGALNESFSDIFGIVIDFYKNPQTANFLIGDAMSPTHSAFRNMQNPNEYKNPDTYKGLFWDLTQEVHINSGVQNFWFYLLCQGGTGTNDLGNVYSVKAIGMEKAAQIAYRNLTVYLTPLSNYSDARFYSIQSAIDLFGECSPEVMAVTNAWHAVGIGEPFLNRVIADFTTSKMNACDIPAQIRFYSKSLNASSYSWDFGDGQTDTTSSPVHTFKSSGSYIVKLISKGNTSCANTDTINKTIAISQGQSPVIASCIPHTLNPGPGGIYAFQFNTINKTANGSCDNYQDYTCTDSTTITEGQKYKITVNVGIDKQENVYAWLDLNNNGKFDDPGELIYQKNKVSWYCSDSIIIPAGVVYNIPLRLRVGSDDTAFPLTDGCTDSRYGQFQDYTVYIRQNISVPAANFSASKRNTINGDTIHFYDNTLNVPTMWNWNFPGGSPSTSTLANPKVTYSIPGKYDVSLTASNAHGTNSIAKSGYITVTKPAPLGLSATIKNKETGEVNLKWSAINDSNVYEDFEDGLADNFTFSDSCFKVEDGYLIASGNGTNKWQSARLEKDFQDFLFEYKFQQLQSGPIYDIGAFFRANGSMNGEDANGYMIDIMTDGSFIISKYVDGSYIYVNPWKTTTAINTTAGAWNIVTIEAIGNLFKIYINAQYVDEFTDDTFASGKIDLICYFQKPYNYDIRWDYMNVITTGTSLAALNLPKAINTIIPGADPRNFIEHPMVKLNNNVVEPKGIINQLKTIQNSDVLSYYKIYRDSVFVKRTDNTTYTDTLPKLGTYNYFVTRMYDAVESKSTNMAAVTWDKRELFPGEDCSNPQDLSTLTSPYVGSTVGYRHDFDFCNMGSSPDRIFFITVPSNYSLKIGSQAATYDMQYSLRTGGECPGNTEIVCADEPNYNLFYTYRNTSNLAQKVYFIMSGYDGDSGYLVFSWQLAPISKPTADFTANLTVISPRTKVNFLDATKEISNNWRWSFPGGNPSSSKLPNPVVEYDSIGYYDVKLIVTNDLGTDSIMRTAYIHVTNNVYCISNLGGGMQCPGDITAVSIKGTSLNNINHSNCSVSQNSNYGSYPSSGNTPPTMKTDTTYELSVTTIFPDKISVWIDYNKNGFFEASEWTRVTAASVPNTPSTVNISIPATALPGATWMRIRTNFFMSPNEASDACSYFGSGITEDYTISITNNPKIPKANFTVKQTAEVNENVQFTDASSGIPTAWRWSFPGGEPSSSTLQNPVVKYPVSGTYDVKLVAVNSLGSDSIVKPGLINITPPQKPVADFMASPTNVFTGAHVNFFDNSTNKPASWKWTFDGGTPSVATTKGASVIYNMPGTYTVKLIVSNAAGADSIIKTGYITVTIPQKPAVNFYTNTKTSIPGPIICFQDKSLNNPVSWQWTLEGATPAFSTEKNPCVTYHTPGIYDVKLTATNAIGTNTLIKEGYITILPAPVPFAQFTVNSRNEVSGTYVHFKDLSSNFPTSWKWTFEGGTPSTSTSREDSVMYTNPGTYDVKLVVSNATGSDSVINHGYITISPPIKPIADFGSYWRDTYTGGGLMVFQDKSLNKPTAWKWIFNGGSPYTVTEKNPRISYYREGVYDVTLIVSNSAGSDTITKKAYSVVLPFKLPLADFTVDTRNTQVNSDIVFAVSATEPVYFSKWTFEGGTPSTSLEYMPKVRYAHTGTYDVKLVVENPAGKDSIIRKDFIRVTLSPPPVASFYANKTTVLKGSPVNFTSNSSYPMTLKWTFPGGKPATSNETNPTILYPTPGIYDVNLVVINEAGTDTLTQTGYINVVSQLRPEANFSANVTHVQSGTEVSFFNRSLNSPTSFKWSFVGGTPSFSTLKNPIVTYKTPGVYDVKLIASNAAGTDSIERLGYIHVIKPDFTADNAVICVKERVQFTDLTNDNPTSWSWTFPGGFPSSSSLKDPLIEFNEPGAKTITLVTDGVFKVAKTNFLVVNVKPKAHIAVIDNQLVSDHPTGNQWYSLTDGMIKEATGQTFMPSHEDAYYLVVTANGCSSENSNTLNYLWSDSKNWNLDQHFSAYPLPVEQFLNIESSLEIESVEVAAIAGQVIFRQENIKAKKLRLDMGAYPPGIYILKAFHAANAKIPVIRKIIKNN